MVQVCARSSTCGEGICCRLRQSGRGKAASRRGLASIHVSKATSRFFCHVCYDVQFLLPPALLPRWGGLQKRIPGGQGRGYTLTNLHTLISCRDSCAINSHCLRTSTCAITSMEGLLYIGASATIALSIQTIQRPPGIDSNHPEPANAHCMSEQAFVEMAHNETGPKAWV